MIGNDDFATKETLNDGRPQYVPIIFDLYYTLKMENGEWKIAGFSNLFNVQSAYLDQPGSADKVSR